MNSIGNFHCNLQERLMTIIGNYQYTFRHINIKNTKLKTKKMYRDANKF